MDSNSFSLSILKSSDGSADFIQGSTSSLSSVNGPIEVKLREELIDKATFVVNSLPLSGAAGPPQKALSAFLHSLFTPLLDLSLHPRSLIQLTTQTTSLPTLSISLPQSTSSTTQRLKGVTTAEKVVSVNSAMLALLDAGVEMNGVVLAVESGEGCFCWRFPEESCVGLEWTGEVHEEDLFEAQSNSLPLARRLLNEIRTGMEEKYGKVVKNAIATMVGGEGAKKKKRKGVAKEVADTEGDGMEED